MNTTQAKKIRLEDFLKKVGYVPVSVKESCIMYKAAYRGDKDASLKVDPQHNIWIDFGNGKGGNIIDLAMLIYNTTDISVCLKNIARDIQFSESIIVPFQKPTVLSEKKSEIEITKVAPLTHVALLQYLEERKIDIKVAQANCKQIHYNIKDKNYFAIGFQNNSGGWELRNKYFKGCSSKDITTIDRGGENCLIFEGFFDFLSYATLHPENSVDNVCVLNTVINLEKSKDFLRKHKTTSTFLDNDDAGRAGVTELQNEGMNIVDESTKYSEYKDLNLYLCSLN